MSPLEILLVLFVNERRFEDSNEFSRFFEWGGLGCGYSERLGSVPCEFGKEGEFVRVVSGDDD